MEELLIDFVKKNNFQAALKKKSINKKYCFEPEM